MRITAMVAFILVGATCFSITFQGVDGNKWVEHLMSNLPGGVWGFLIVVNLFVFFLAFFLDFFEIAFIIIPMLAPVAQKILEPVVGHDAALIWFGVMICVNVQTSFMHPPFGFALFYLRSVAPKEVKSSDIYWGSIPWVLLQLIMVVIVIGFPQSVTYFLDAPSTVDPTKIKIEIQAPPTEDSAPPVFKNAKRSPPRRARRVSRPGPCPGIGPCANRRGRRPDHRRQPDLALVGPRRTGPRHRLHERLERRPCRQPTPPEPGERPGGRM